MTNIVLPNRTAIIKAVIDSETGVLRVLPDQVIKLGATTTSLSDGESVTFVLSAPLSPARGGTGVNNGANTLTLTGVTTITDGGTLALGGYTLTVPKTGTAVVGTGAAGRIAEWVTDANTLQASSLIKSGAGVLTLSASSGYTLTVPATGTAALMDYANNGNFRASSVDDAGYIALGAAPAASGSIRLPYGSALKFRNSTNTGDVTVFSVLSGNALQIGRENTSQTLIYGGASIDVFFADSTSNIYLRVEDAASSPFLSLNVAKLNASGYYLAHYINSAVYSNPMFGIYGNGRDHVFIGELDTTTGQTLTVKPFADRVALRVTGFATQTVSRPLINLIRNDANTNAVGAVLTAAVNTTGTAAAGLGGSFDLRLESSTTADTPAALIKWLWNNATHASRSADLVLSAYDTAEREFLRGRGAGSAAALAFYGGTPVTRGAALTAQLTTITHTAPTTPDYAIQDLTDTGGFGFATKDEGNTVLSVIANLQTRLAELEARLNSATGVNLIA